jgi:hypothetical protein
VRMEQGEKDEMQNVQVQADRPHRGRPALLLRSRPVTTEREHHHLKGYAVDLPRGTLATVGGRPAWPLRAAIKSNDGDVPQCTSSSGLCVPA